ncbi:MAG: glutathione S-transferase N-terminal domain-containing protein [Bradyrhizobium sp.]|nr:glutathione S-transferase N-terminal domain-containing protein [Bradyrhizobium sp.]
MREIGLPFSIEVVNVTAKRRADGSDYKAVASRGMVPLLELDDGERLTENLVIAQYLCDRSERHDLMPPAGTMSRYHVMEWQSFIAAELHKSLVPLYWPRVEARTGELVVARIRGRLGFVEREMTGAFLTGDIFTAADTYLFVIASWTRYFKIPLDDCPRLLGLLERVDRRPSVHAALAAEGPGFVTVSDLKRFPDLVAEGPEAFGSHRIHRSRHAGQRRPRAIMSG